MVVVVVPRTVHELLHPSDGDLFLTIIGVKPIELLLNITHSCRKGDNSAYRRF